MRDLCERFGAATVCEAFAAILKGAADELRGAIAALPPGQASSEGVLDSDGVVVDRPIKLAVTVTIADGIATFDFSKSAPQASGPVNLRPSMVEACVFYCLIGCLGPRIAYNDGMRDVMRLVLAPRTITNAEPPASVSNYQMVNLKLVDVILEALSQSGPRGRSPMPVHRVRSALRGATSAPAIPRFNTRSSVRPTAAAWATTAPRQRRRT